MPNELYNKLNRIDELEQERGIRKLTKEERLEYDSLTRKKLYTLDEIRKYHDTMALMVDELNRLLEKKENITLEEALDKLDTESRTELISYLREGILSGIRQKHGPAVEEELSLIINSELNSSLDRYLARQSKEEISIKWAEKMLKK